MTIASQSITLNDGLITSQSTGFIGPGGDIALGLRQFNISNGGQIDSFDRKFRSPGARAARSRSMNSPRDSPHQSHFRVWHQWGQRYVSLSAGNANPGEISITTGTLADRRSRYRKRRSDSATRGASITIVTQ